MLFFIDHRLINKKLLKNIEKNIIEIIFLKNIFKEILSIYIIYYRNEF
jgi:hypothetical protein